MLLHSSHQNVDNLFRHFRLIVNTILPVLFMNRISCKDCGAAVPGNEPTLLSRLRKPYRHPHKYYECSHSPSRIVNTYLGNQFRTDMVVYEIALDSEKINVGSSGLWIRRAGQTLAEAITLAGGRLLDIEFNEIKSGYRLRYSHESHTAYVDIFLFDSLSSGAGYCSALAERTSELMNETRKVLNTCPAGCDCACHECLMHYWNQCVHGLLDRYATLDLLNWCESSTLASSLPYKKQEELLMPLNSLGADFNVSGGDTHHFIERHGKKQEIVAYPAMWNEHSNLLPPGAITTSDQLLKYAMPKVDAL